MYIWGEGVENLLNLNLNIFTRSSQESLFRFRHCFWGSLLWVFTKTSHLVWFFVCSMIGTCKYWDAGALGKCPLTQEILFSFRHEQTSFIKTKLPSYDHWYLQVLGGWSVGEMSVDREIHVRCVVAVFRVSRWNSFQLFKIILIYICNNKYV